MSIPSSSSSSSYSSSCSSSSFHKNVPIYNDLKPNDYMHVIVLKNSPYFTYAKDVLFKQIEEFYNYKKNIIKTFEPFSDRRCEMLLFKDKPIGIIVYKKENENYNFIVKNFILIDKKNIGQGYRTVLLNRILDIAQNKRAKNVFIKLNDSDEYNIDFFEHKGFEAMKEKVRKNYHNFTYNLAKNESPKYEKEKIFEKKGTKRLREEKELPENEKLPVNRIEKKSMTPFDIEQNVSSSAFPFKVQPKKPIFSGPIQHKMTLRKEYIHQIRDGKKTIEGRINDGVFLNYKIGDQIRFYYHQDFNDDVVCKILDIKKFNSFNEMLQTVGFKNCLAEVNSLDEAIKVYNSIPTYFERAKKYGVLAIKIESLGSSIDIKK